MRLLSSSSLCSIRHTCLCWARKRNTTALRKHGAQRQAVKQSTEAVSIMCGTRPPVWIHLLSASFCRSISSSRSFLCSVTLWIFWWHSLSSSLKKKKCWIEKTKKHISSYYNSTFMTLLIWPVGSVSGTLWAHLHTNTSDALITGFYLLMVRNTTCQSM